MFELVTNGMMINGSRFASLLKLDKHVSLIIHYYCLLKDIYICNVHRTLDMLNSSQQDGDHSAYFTRKIQPELFASKNAIHFPLAKDGALYDQVKIICFYSVCCLLLLV